MWGRAGRRGKGLAVYVAGEDALDQFLLPPPPTSSSSWPVEAAILDHESPQIADDPQVRRILRQGNAGSYADLEHTATNLVGGKNSRAPALAEHAAEHEVVDRRPAVVGLLDHFAVEIQLPLHRQAS